MPPESTNQAAALATENRRTFQDVETLVEKIQLLDLVLPSLDLAAERQIGEQRRWRLGIQHSCRERVLSRESTRDDRIEPDLENVTGENLLSRRTSTSISRTSAGSTKQANVGARTV